MSYATFYGRKILGNARYEDLKAEVLGSGVSAVVAGLPKSEDGAPPRAIVDTRVSVADWQPLAALAALTLLTYYFLRS